MSTGRSLRQLAVRRDDGFIAPVTMALLGVLLVLSALAVDVGSWMAQTSRQQRTADAAALAAVVWLPDTASATAVALDIAERNGFEDGVDGASVTVTYPTATDVTVTITAPGNLYFGQLVTDSVTLSRDATARYVLPVPLGSPRNFFGTGDMNVTSDPDIPLKENIWLAINTWCTDKEDGDRFQSRYFKNRAYNGSHCDGVSNGSIPNAEYTGTNGYELYIEAPEGRTQNIQVRLHSPNYENTHDLNLGISGAHQYTFTLYEADATPFDDTDNVIHRPGPGTTNPECRQAYNASGALAGSYSWLGANWVTLCTIEPSDPSGRYRLVVHNNAVPGGGQVGANAWSLAAVYPSLDLCDGRTTANCPRVFGKEFISVFATLSGTTADFYLAEVDPIHTGKKLELTLWDPGEGANSIRVRRPTGTNSWTDQSFSWIATDDHGSANATSGSGTVLDVTSSRFNGELVTITVDLAGYSPPADNHWWQIRYNVGGSPTDRTTWGVRVVGDPVHLVD